MLRPAYRITVGDQVIDTTIEARASTALELTVRLDLDTPADAVTLRQGQVGGLRAQPGDTMSVDLGYADEDKLVRVLTGSVVAVEPGLQTQRITGHSGGDTLLRTFMDRTFEDTTAGAIVRALATAAGLDVASVEDGPALPAYVIDGRRPVARHVRDLAYLAGFDTWVTADGKLVFEGFTGNRTVHRLRYGEHVLHAELRRSRPRAGSVQVWGDSPGAGGDESWAWLTKDFGPRHGTSGSAPPMLLIERAAVRTGRLAAAVAQAAAETLTEQALHGRVRIQGRPQLLLGQLIRLEGFPDRAGVDALEGTYQVRAVRHHLTKAAGLTTDVAFRSLQGVAP
ncbi:hypothetical protein ABZ721_18755 [Streptomyces sp. NPDC006733]|uniref:hypothetical protein n=1 Tax=Streptomyces sp. NPDC006733 TaxID=3155460 RepID=UPI0033FF694E